MSTGAIIAIVVVAVIILALLAFMLPRMRRNAELKKRERELHQRRERAAEEQRAEADARDRQASEAEQRAKIAQREAEAERAQAQLHSERAGMHEKGMADHELVDERERDRFAPVMDRDRDGVDDRREASTDRHDRDGDGVDDRRETGGARAASTDDYQQGRHDEAVDRDRPARFDRDEATERRDAPSRYSSKLGAADSSSAPASAASSVAEM
jgi:hypothetical protein